MLTKISKLNLSYLTKSCRHTLSPNEKILRQIYFLSHFATMAIDSANPADPIFPDAIPIPHFKHDNFSEKESTHLILPYNLEPI